MGVEYFPCNGCQVIIRDHHTELYQRASCNHIFYESCANVFINEYPFSG